MIDLSDRILDYITEFSGFVFAQKMRIWVFQVIRIAAVCVLISVDVQNVPSMAVFHLEYGAHFLYEIRPMIDFQTGNVAF